MLTKGANILLLILGVVTLILSLVSVNTNLKNELAAFDILPHGVDATDLENAAYEAERKRLELRAPDGSTLQANAVILVVVSVLLVLLESNGAFKLNIKSEPIIIVVPLFLVVFGLLSILMPGSNWPVGSRGTAAVLARIKTLVKNGNVSKGDVGSTRATAGIGSFAYGVCTLVGLMFGGSVLMGGKK
jgi:hypothetical protein